MSKRAVAAAELIANGIMIHAYGKTGRVVYNTAEKSFDHHDLMSAARKAYEQAEKDLALTWRDMKLVIAAEGSIYDEHHGNSREVLEAYPTEEAFYDEVLERYKKIKEESK